MNNENKGSDKDVKYMGSKSRIAKYLVPIIQKCIDDNNIKYYYEPFVGGANIIDKIKCQKRYGYDSNEYLIAFWNELQKGWNPFDNILMTNDLYNDIKNNKDNYFPCVVALAGFCATYNAKWFGSYAGIVRTKIGTIRNYYDESVRNVLKQLSDLQDVYFKCEDFESQFKSLKQKKNYLIYCDPPYQLTTSYKDSINYLMYWDKIRKLSENNYVLCSEYNAPSDFIEIWSKETTITLDNRSRNKSVEKLFTYKNGMYAHYIKNCK